MNSIKKEDFNYQINKFLYKCEFYSQFDLEEDLGKQILNFNYDQDTIDHIKQSIVDGIVSEFRMKLNTKVFGDPSVDVTGTYGMKEKQYKKLNKNG